MSAHDHGITQYETVKSVLPVYFLA